MREGSCCLFFVTLELCVHISRLIYLRVPWFSAHLHTVCRYSLLDFFQTDSDLLFLYLFILYLYFLYLFLYVLYQSYLFHFLTVIISH